MGLMRVCATIDLDAIKNNIEAMKANMQPNAKMMLVVKTDGYGHGAIPIAGLGEDDPRIFGYAVAAVEEGIALRDAGIKKSILILGHTFLEDVDRVILNDLTPAVFSMDLAKALSSASEKLHKPVKIHLAVDTGMSRIGFQVTEEEADLAVKISHLPGIIVEGMFTHFSKADETDKEFTNHQMAEYQRFETLLNERGLNIPIRHVSNSAGIVDLPNMNLDMVRAGITLYGLYPSEEVDKKAVKLTPAMSLTSHIAHIKMLEKDRIISYGGTYRTEEPRRVATVSVGYGDGYPRGLSNKGYVLIHGKKAPILGRVCMDQMMVDVTDIPEAKVEDLVTLIGTDGDAQISVEELGEIANKFNYEFVCGISPRVPRVYKY